MEVEICSEFNQLGKQFGSLLYNGVGGEEQVCVYPCYLLIAVGIGIYARLGNTCAHSLVSREWGVLMDR